MVCITLFLFLLFFWRPCMVINVSVQYEGGLLPDIIILLTQYNYLNLLGEPVKMPWRGFVFAAYDPT